MVGSVFMIALGIILIAAGVAVILVTQLVLFRWLKKFNEEWGEKKNEMS